MTEFALSAGKNSSIISSVTRSGVTVAIHAVDRQRRAGDLALLESGTFFSEHAEGSTRCIHVIVSEGKAEAWCNSGGAETVVNRGIDGLVEE